MSCRASLCLMTGCRSRTSGNSSWVVCSSFWLWRASIRTWCKRTWPARRYAVPRRICVLMVWLFCQPICCFCRWAYCWRCGISSRALRCRLWAMNCCRCMSNRLVRWSWCCLCWALWLRRFQVQIQRWPRWQPSIAWTSLVRKTMNSCANVPIWPCVPSLCCSSCFSRLSTQRVWLMPSTLFAVIPMDLC